MDGGFKYERGMGQPRSLKAKYEEARRNGEGYQKQINTMNKIVQ